MKRTLHLEIILVIVITFFAASLSFAQQIRDLIQPINFSDQNEKQILVSDLFYSYDYDGISFPENDVVEVNYDSLNQVVTFSAPSGFNGMGVIPFNFKDVTYHIPFFKEKKDTYVFTFDPEGEPKNVNLFGQFNSWNRESLPMKDDDGDGVYEITIPLDPGRYEYKFYVDGLELIDPSNPVKVPNGLGDFNSVLVIDENPEDKLYLHIVKKETTPLVQYINFFLEGGEEEISLDYSNFVVLLNNKLLEEKWLEFDGKMLSVTLNKKRLEGKKTLRIAGMMDDKFSNIQTIEFYDGEPKGINDNFHWNDAIIYSIMIDRFNDGNLDNSVPVEHPELSVKANYQGGDLQGIINKIEDGYFDSLGINTLWISPVVDNTPNAFKEYPPPHRFYTGYHGYWPVSATRVEERFGDMELLKKLVNIAHQNGIKVLLDYVANHVHEEHPLWTEQRDWFGKLELPDGKLNLRLWDEQRLTTWFEPYMPSFDYEGSSEALEYMTDNAVWWLKETGADGFRHDAVKHVPNKFWRTLTRKIKKNIEVLEDRHIYQIGETFGGFDLISSYVNNGQLSAQFNFNLYDVALPVFLNPETSFKMLDHQMLKTFKVYGYNHVMGNLIDSHDKIRYMAYADGDLEINDGEAKEIAWTNPPVVDDHASYDELSLHLAYILSIPGVPVIYYGDEFGMTGAADPDNRRMMRFDHMLTDEEQKTFEEVKKIINIREKHPAFRYGDFYTVRADSNIYAYIRSDVNERILVILNKSNEEKGITLDLPKIYRCDEMTDLINPENFKAREDKLFVTVRPYGYRYLKINY